MVIVPGWSLVHLVRETSCPVRRLKMSLRVHSDHMVTPVCSGDLCPTDTYRVRPGLGVERG